MRQFTALSLIVLATGCDSESHSPARPFGEVREEILTAADPVQWMTAYLVGESIPVTCLVPVGTDPRSWSPSTADVERFQNARLIIFNGGGLEKWATAATLPPRCLVSSAGFADEFIQTVNTVAHRHGPAGVEKPGGLDPAIWLDPTLARKQARRIAEAIRRDWPTHQAEVDQNLGRLNGVFDDFEREFRDITERLARRRIASEPGACSYPARRFGWTLEQVSANADGSFSAEQLKGLRGVAAFVWKEAPTAAAESQLQTIGIPGVIFNPAVRSASTDFEARMRKALVDLKQALQESTSPGA